MQITRDAGTLTDAGFHPGIKYLCYLTEAIAIHRPKHCKAGDQDRHTEPSSLVVRGRDRKIQRCAGLVPHAAVVGSYHTEAVVARREIVVERLATIARVLPLAVVPFQLVAKL